MGDPARGNVILDWLFGVPVPARKRENRSAHPPAGARRGGGGFQPFGYRFDIRSRLSPAGVKGALQSRMKDWFDPKPGARGWIVGPFICLWFRDFGPYGPMLLATVRRDDLGARVTGRAGSDLNGLALQTVLTPVLAFLLYKVMAAGDYRLRDLLVIGGALLVSPLMFWWSHSDRRKGDPLVRFVQDAVARAEGRGPVVSTKAVASGALTLKAAGEDRVGPTAEEVHDALLNLCDGDSVVLAIGEGTYIQAMSQDGGYVLERRDGGAEAHFQATRGGDPSGIVLRFEQVGEVFTAWADGEAPPRWLVWEPVTLAGWAGGPA